MENQVTKQKMIYRQNLRDNQNTIYLFGDNMKRVGMGGQAGEMRGEVNAVGVPTKKEPNMEEASFFSDYDFVLFKETIDAALLHPFVHVFNGGLVVIPEDGLGTGLSQLPERAPQCHEYLSMKLAKLVTLGENN